MLSEHDCVAVAQSSLIVTQYCRVDLMCPFCSFMLSWLLICNWVNYQNTFQWRYLISFVCVHYNWRREKFSHEFSVNAGELNSLVIFFEDKSHAEEIDDQLSTCTYLSNFKFCNFWLGIHQHLVTRQLTNWIYVSIIHQNLCKVSKATANLFVIGKSKAGVSHKCIGLRPTFPLASCR